MYFSDKNKALLMKEENPYVMSVLRMGRVVFGTLEERCTYECLKFWVR